MDSVFTCLSCQIAFSSSEFQRNHYKSEWHRYNLKRKVAGMSPLSFDAFQQRSFENAPQVAKKKPSVNLFCPPCNRKFTNENMYQDHFKSSKHVKNAEEFKKNGSVEKSILAPVAKQQEEKDKVESTEMLIEANADEAFVMEKVKEQLSKVKHLEVEECLFCSLKFDSLEENVRHMTLTHSLFIPDIEYLVDLRGLIQYLGEKIALGLTCLYCNGKGRGFHSLEAVRKHMIDKSHCKLNYDNDGDLEYVDFYDFHRDDSVDPNDMEVEEVDEFSEGEFEDDNEKALIISPDESELILPSGMRLGHRAYRRYYKQRFRPEDDRDSVIINKMVSEYKTLGYETIAPVDRSIQRERLALRSDEDFKVALKNNKQFHFRLQFRQ